MPIPSTIRNPYPKITCAICRRQVEKITWYEDPRSQKLVIVVGCHGDTDSMELTDQQRMEFGDQLQNAEGLAFTQGKIKNG